MFLKASALLSGMIMLRPNILPAKRMICNSKSAKEQRESQTLINGSSLPFGVDKDGFSRIYYSKNDSPEKNINKILEMIGGIKTLIGNEDIVILKPNAQWWNQGMTNTNAMKAFIETILSLNGFQGEIIIAENHQYDEPNSRGWTTEYKNGDFNLNELVHYFQNRGFPNVTKSHWRPVTPLLRTEQPNLCSSKIVEGPWQGEGYVYDKQLTYISPLGRKCILSYPVFRSFYSGKLIDFRKGVWSKGEYSNQPVKFINFSAINHHGPYVGVTASVKNYMGIVDMSCGHPRGLPSDYYNVHFIGVRGLPDLYEKYVPWRIRQKISSFLFSYQYKYFCHTAGCLGSFMKKIRMADLNIITAHWVGFGSRLETKLSGYPKAIVAGRDPVALDYWTTKNILFPLTKKASSEKSFIELNDPDRLDGPFRKFLAACHAEGIGNLDDNNMKIYSA